MLARLVGCLFLIFAPALLSGGGFAAEPLGLCYGPNRAERKVTCLVDGDTGWEAGVKWRLQSIDTPEYPPFAECIVEPEYAKAATFRMLELMRGGYQIEWLGEKGKAGRDLVKIRLSDGRDAGSILVAEGLALEWPHPPKAWCGAPIG